MNYVCKYGLYHDKEVISGEPRSNNGWIYSAYASVVGLELNVIKLAQTIIKCDRSTEKDFIVDRLPQKPSPPLSIDELIGMVSIGIVHGRVLESYKWYYHEDQSKTSWLTALKAAWKIRKEHRNYFWENQITPVYKLAFKVMPHHMHYIKRKSGMKSTCAEKTLFLVHVLVNSMSKKHYIKNVSWLMLKDLDSKFLIKLFNHRKNLTAEFGKDHPIVKSI